MEKVQVWVSVTAAVSDREAKNRRHPRKACLRLLKQAENLPGHSGKQLG
ncbi:MAG: hypothetical protein ACOYM2_12335 [Rectinemataceae bacterium]